MNITPSSTITFYGTKGVPNKGTWTTFPISPGVQLLFKSVSEQQETMENFKILTVNDCQYVRSTGRVKIDLNQFQRAVGFFYKSAEDVLRNIEYMSFVNPDLGSRTYYAFVSDYNYVNNDCVEISWALDPWMSYMDVVEMEPCNILREHMSKYDENHMGLNSDYSPVMDMQTPEPLAIGEQLEPEVYTYSNTLSKSADVYPIMATLTRGGSYDPAEMMSLLYLAPINFDALDEAATGTKPSEYFQAFLDSVKASEYGYYVTPEGRLVTGVRYESNSHLTTLLTSKCYIIAIPGNMSSAFVELLNKLTLWQVVNNILAIYSIPTSMVASSVRSSSGDSVIFQTEWSVPNGVSAPLVTVEGMTGKRRLNPKLGTFPFSYARLISPSGDIKELQFEHFARTSPTDYGKLVTSMDVFNAPTLQISPKNYRQGDLSVSRNGANAIECIRYSQFPTIPYMIDSWLYQTGANALSLISNMTVDTHMEMEQSVIAAQANLVGAAENVIKKGISIGTSVASLGSIKSDGGSFDTSGVKGFSPFGVAGSLYAGAAAQTQMDRVANQANMYDSARDMLLGNTNNVAYANFAQTKPAYAANKYTPSSGVGSINFIRDGFVDILYQHVHLDDDVLIAYDEWFRRFGYSSKRVGVPHVFAYMHQSDKTTDADLPSWNEYSEGAGAGSIANYRGYRCTYIQTANCHVHGVPREVGRLIEEMFDRGVQFWDTEAITRNNTHSA